MLTKARIAVNLLHVVPGNVGGSEEYSVETLRAVAESRPEEIEPCLLYTSPSPRDRQKSRMPSSA